MKMSYYIVEHPTRGVFMGWKEDAHLPGDFKKARFSHTARRTDAYRVTSFDLARGVLTSLEDQNPKLRGKLYLTEMPGAKRVEHLAEAKPKEEPPMRNEPLPTPRPLGFILAKPSSAPAYLEVFAGFRYVGGGKMEPTWCSGAGQWGAAVYKTFDDADAALKDLETQGAVADVYTVTATMTMGG